MRLIVSILIALVCMNASSNEINQRTVNIVFASEMPEIHGNKGRYAKLATMLKQQRQADRNTFFFFGGGSLGPSILASFDKGSHIIDLLNSLEPDAMGVSKREFSFYPENLSLRAYDATFPIVATNVIDAKTGGNLDGIVNSTLTEQNGITIGFMSIIDSGVLEDYTFNQISLIDPQQAIKKAAVELRAQGAELLVLQYTGYYPVINQLLDDGVVDLSLHKDESYQDVDYSSRKYNQRDVFIKSPSGVATILITLDNQKTPKITDFSYDIKDLDSYTPDKVVAKQVDGHVGRLKSILSVEIGKFTVPITTKRTLVRSSENAFGNYVADSVREFADAQIAIINSGSIRGDLDYSAGSPITREIIANELPFRGMIALIEVSGATLFRAMENAVSALDVYKGRFAQVSGMVVVFDSSEPVGQRIKSIKINGQGIKLTQMYTVATTDYLVSGGDGYEVFKGVKKLGAKHLAIRLVSDIVTDNITRDKMLSPQIDGRLVDIKAKINER